MNLMSPLTSRKSCIFNVSASEHEVCYNDYNYDLNIVLMLCGISVI
jgi:hypothetical protein